MNIRFADTSYYIALLVREDDRHEVAVHWSRKARRIVLTDCVTVELGSALARSRWRTLLPKLARELRSDPFVEIVPLSQTLLNAGLALYGERPDKEWSLTDCISFLVMEERSLSEALTTDHHFEQAGFKALLV